MDSPDKSQLIIASDVQESPFYKYLCDLSPIKPARPVHVAQTYSDLTLPPPPAVFTSPPPNSLKGSARIRRDYGIGKTSLASESAWAHKNPPASPKDFNPSSSHVNNNAVFTRQAIGYVQFSRPSSDQGAVKAAHNNANGTPPKAEAGDVELYLADSADGGLYAVRSCDMRTIVSSMVTTSVAISGLSEKSHGCRDSDSATRDKSCANQGALKQASNEVASACHAQESGSGSLNPDQVSQDMSTMLEEMRTHHVEDSTSTDGPQTVQSHAASGCAANAGGLEASRRIHEGTEGMTYLMGAEGAHNHPNAADNWVDDPADVIVSRLPLRRTSGYPTTQLGPGPPQENEVHSFASPKAPSDASLDDNQSLQCREILQDKEQMHQAHGTCRVGVTGQRGVRRRCLDFEASEARRKSMGGNASRKGVSTRSREVAAGASYLASGASIPSQVLSDRAGSQSDATNSGRSSIAEADNQVGADVDNKIMPSLMRLTCCSMSKTKDAASEKPGQPMHASRDSIPCSVSMSLPSGIGLHLNSLAGSSISFSPARGFNCSTGMSTASLLGLTPMSALKENPTDSFDQSLDPAVSAGNLSFVTSAAFASGGCVSVVEITREEEQDIKVSESAMVGSLKSTTCFRSVTLGVKPVQSRLQVEDVTEKRLSPKRRMPHQELLRQHDLDMEELFESPRSPKKRRKSAVAGDKSSEGCRRCNCKKSKCLKLYCECFAAGIYCVGSCTCQDCFNKPEHEEKVLETRQLIESRNPLAFAPKIVHSKDNSPTSGDECNETPASARHKRGCNCKKSLCLKKYCECFQAGVGCSEGCRCEGCQNVFGKKEAFTEEQEEHMSQDALDENESQEQQLEMLDGPLRSERLRSGTKDLSPITPSFPYAAGQARSSSRVRSTAKKRCSREAGGSPLPVKYAPKPPRSPVKPPRLSSRSSNPRSCVGSARAPQQIPRNGSSPTSTPKARAAMLSPRWDGLGDICTLTPLPQPPVRPTPASASTIDRSGASPSFHRQSVEVGSGYSAVRGCDFSEASSPALKQKPRSQSPVTRCAPNGNLSHSPHSTPATPSLSSSQGALGGKSFCSSGSDMLPAYLGYDGAEEDAPDFLRYSEPMQSPQILTNTSSPKQIKRVSPPHHESMARERASNGSSRRMLSPSRGSPGVRSGRKFILQALPSFPSVTPPFSSLRNQFNNG